MSKTPSKIAKVKIKINTGSEKLNEASWPIATKYTMKKKDIKTLKLVINQVEIFLSLIFEVFNNEMEMKKIYINVPMIMRGKRLEKCKPGDIITTGT